MPTTTICQRCGGVRPAPPPPVLNVAEKVAVANGWTLGDFRALQLQLAFAKPRAAAAAAVIPAAPDPHALIRAAHSVERAAPLVVPRAAVVATAIPPAPDPWDRIRAARGGR